LPCSFWDHAPETLGRRSRVYPAGTGTPSGFAILKMLMRPLTLWMSLLLVPGGIAWGQAAGQQQKPAFEAASGAAEPRFPLREIKVEGNKEFTKEEIADLSGLKIGESVRSADFEKALDRINDAGVFEALEFRYEPFSGGYRVIFTVDEVDNFYTLRLKGFGIPDEEILQRLKAEVPSFSRRVPATGVMVERIGDALRAIWKEQGHDGEIEGLLLPDGDDFEMVFRPPETVQTIAMIKFENTQVIPALDLQRDLFSAFSGAPYSEERLQELLLYNVSPLYGEKGRLAVRYCPCTAEPDTDTKGLIVTVHIEEGPEFTFGRIDMPDLSDVSEDKRLGLQKAKPDELANMKLVQETLAALDGFFRANGYMNALVDFEKSIDEANRKVDIVINAGRGDKYTFGKLTINGLDLIAEAAVRKRWGMEAGAAFNAGYPAFFLDTIVREGMFDNLKDTGWSIQVNDRDKTVDVELKFQ
jgi:outer membrane protein assembly factor BamA